VSPNYYYRDDDFSFSRSYNSYSGGWRFSYRQKLIVDPSFIIAERIDGKGVYFANENGSFNATSQRRESLRFDGSVYSLRLTNNTIETYDASGRLLYIDSQYQERTSLTYIDDQVIVSKAGVQLLLTLGANGEVAQADFPNGTNNSYTYQFAANRPLLTSVLSSTGFSNVFFYEDSRFLTNITGIEDENGNRISSVIYDDQGRAISSEAGPLNSGIERTQIQYNADGTRTLTNALGKQNIYHFTQFNGEYKMTQVEGIASDNCAAANKNYTYDTNGFMASKTDWKGNTTTYLHNDRGQELSRTEASGTPQARSIATEWHSEFNLPVRIVEPERETVMTYDANGRLLSRQVKSRIN
jgi:YD repeat-containing protein